MTFNNGTRSTTQYPDGNSFVWFYCIKKLSLLFLILNSTVFILFWGLAPLFWPMGSYSLLSSDVLKNGGRLEFSFVFMLISPTSLANMATMSLFGASTWPSWRHTQTHDLGRYDLKQKNQDALRILRQWSFFVQFYYIWTVFLLFRLLNSTN